MYDHYFVGKFWEIPPAVDERTTNPLSVDALLNNVLLFIVQMPG